MFKGAWSNFSEWRFLFNDPSSPKKSWYQIAVKLVKPFWYMKRLFVLQLPILDFVSVIMVAITSHISGSIFQTLHFSAVKFAVMKEKIWAFFWYQNLRKFEKKSEAIGPGTFKVNIVIMCYCEDCWVLHSTIFMLHRGKFCMWYLTSFTNIPKMTCREGTSTICHILLLYSQQVSNSF